LPLYSADIRLGLGVVGAIVDHEQNAGERLIEVHQRPAATHEAISPAVEASCDTRSHIYVQLVDVAYAGRVVPHAARTSARAWIARSAQSNGQEIRIYICVYVDVEVCNHLICIKLFQIFNCREPEESFSKLAVASTAVFLS
jgi:hypothetical protein